MRNRVAFELEGTSVASAAATIVALIEVRGEDITPGIDRGAAREKAHGAGSSAVVGEPRGIEPRIGVAQISRVIQNPPGPVPVPPPAPSLLRLAPSEVIVPPEFTKFAPLAPFLKRLLRRIVLAVPSKVEL